MIRQLMNQIDLSAWVWARGVGGVFFGAHVADFAATTSTRPVITLAPHNTWGWEVIVVTLSYCPDPERPYVFTEFKVSGSEPWTIAYTRTYSSGLIERFQEQVSREDREDVSAFVRRMLDRARERHLCRQSEQ